MTFLPMPLQTEAEKMKLPIGENIRALRVEQTQRRDFLFTRGSASSLA